jgi:hypothetical protein
MHQFVSRYERHPYTSSPLRKGIYLPLKGEGGGRAGVRALRFQGFYYRRIARIGAIILRNEPNKAPMIAGIIVLT